MHRAVSNVLMGYVSARLEAHESREPKNPQTQTASYVNNPGVTTRSHGLITQQVAAPKQENNVQIHNERKPPEV